MCVCECVRVECECLFHTLRLICLPLETLEDLRKCARGSFNPKGVSKAESDEKDKEGAHMGIDESEVRACVCVCARTRVSACACACVSALCVVKVPFCRRCISPGWPALFPLLRR